MLRKITILGSTGSIGVQTLNVLEDLQDDFEINFLTANNNIELLEHQIKKFNPKGVVIANESSYFEFKRRTSFRGLILSGQGGVIQAASDKSNDLVISALVGFSGVLPTLSAIEAGIDVALANKETLVSAGSIITDSAKKNSVKILALDSEHNAILQCLAGENYENIEKLILTASGGPFRNLDIDKFDKITLQQALNHPNWTMGSKITIDSATMMNKGFEIIEAKWLFDIDINKIEVVIHPQSIIHSLVQFIDGSVKAQLGMPDMRIPISYILNSPGRKYHNFPRIDLVKLARFDFFEPDLNRFPCLGLAYYAIEKGGNFPCALNAANEICVNSFLKENISFNEISVYIEKVLSKLNFIEKPCLEDIIQTDNEIRELTQSLIRN